MTTITHSTRTSNASLPHRSQRRMSTGSVGGLFRRLGRHTPPEIHLQPTTCSDMALRGLDVESDDSGKTTSQSAPQNPVLIPEATPGAAHEKHPNGHMRTRRRGSASEAMLQAAVAATFANDSDDDSDSDDSAAWGSWSLKKAERIQQQKLASPARTVS